MKSILVTQPKKESELLAQRLEKSGYKVVVEPLLKINLIPKKILIKKKIQAILITSANGIEFLKSMKLPKNILIIAVGKKTASAIFSAGYDNIIWGQNTSLSILDLAEKILVRENGLVLYLAGKIVNLDLAKELNKKGFEARKIITYEAIARKKLSAGLISRIKNNQIDMVLIYSINSAQILYKLIVKHNLLKNFKAVRILCFSPRIADYCLSLGFKNLGEISEII